MARSIASMFALYILTPGRRIYALGRVLDRAKEHGIDDLAPGIELARAHDRKSLQLDAARHDRAKVLVRQHDSEVDRTLSAILNLLSHYAGSNEPTAAALVSILFPHGLAAHVQLPFVEQAAANDRVLTVLEGEEHAQWLDAHGLRPLIEELRAKHDTFDSALKARDSTSVPSWDDVKESLDRGQELYLEIVAQIIWQFRGDPKLRDELLEPIWHQNQRIQQYRKQRRTVVDVNPDTGEELELGGDGEDGGSSPPPASA